ncbi:RmlC-like cupin domain-containing protein [Chytriomyces cf. hyalinus JEL632]|nr:RmlC-like cupin domain-containing protein [Chytriomyces cf. hyalinus JEL632]
MSTATIHEITPAKPMRTQEPFLFAVYHKDHFPPGDDQMRAPTRGNGNDFNTSKPYRMYHGERVPGFPAHPHRGFETITCTIEGLIDHTDSTGAGGRYGNGDVQWMVAGKGVVHAEMLPLIKQAEEGNMSRFFQLWLNLPAKSKMVETEQRIHWSENITNFTSSDSLTKATIWAGSLQQREALTPPSNSWSNATTNPESNVHIWFLQMKPGAKYTLPKPASSSLRTLYAVEGDEMTLQDPITLTKTRVPVNSAVTFETNANAVIIELAASSAAAEILVLEGSPIGEPISRHGPFVMNSREEVMQAFNDYRTTQFGGWPWRGDSFVFPRENGRFLQLSNGDRMYPPSLGNDGPPSAGSKQNQQ